MFSLAGNSAIEALSGICGSISIACWVVVFSPQIIENFRRSSAEGLSLVFLVIWLVGDVFNILGSVMQGVLPTMTILAGYYTVADIVLLGQCFYYRGFTLRDDVSSPGTPASRDAENGPVDATERTSLLPAQKTNGHSGEGHSSDDRTGDERRASTSSSHHHSGEHRHRRLSGASFREMLHDHVDGTHLSPTTPFIDPSHKETPPAQRRSRAKTAAFNASAILLVCILGFIGWYLIQVPSKHDHRNEKKGQDLHFDPMGQIFGYLCAVLYLGSRVPQILLNCKRKSTEGVSLLFFVFACLGNLTYVLSIVAYSPVCEGHSGHCRPGESAGIYCRYILVNLSWLIGSLGTLFLDMAIFVQFFIYKDNNAGAIVSRE